MLTRLRQLALHPSLIPSNYLQQLQIADLEENSDEGSQAPPLTPAEKIRLQALLAQAIEDQEECPVCFNILEDPRITSCTHFYCFAWCVLIPVPCYVYVLKSPSASLLL